MDRAILCLSRTSAHSLLAASGASRTPWSPPAKRVSLPGVCGGAEAGGRVEAARRVIYQGVRVSLEPSKVGWACVEKSGLLGHGLLDGPDKKERFKSLLAYFSKTKVPSGLLFIYLFTFVFRKKN